MKKIFIPLALLPFMLGTVSCGTFFDAGGWEERSLFGGGKAHIANPFTDHETMALAEQAAGFTMDLPERMEGYGERLIQTMDGRMIQVIYLQGESRLFLRKAAGAGDISGDHTGYPEMRSVRVGKCQVTMKGSGGRVKNAVWSSGGYAYAVMSDEALTYEEMKGLVSEVR